ASQRKFTSAMAPPPPTPAAACGPASHHAPTVMAATVMPPVQVTRAARSAIITLLTRVGILLVQCLDGSVEVHAGRRDAESEPDQQEPRARPDPTIGEEARGQPDRHTCEQHRPQIDELCSLTPRRPLLGRSHVNRNTITGIRG